VTDALHVGAGGAHSCAKTSTGTLACWGAHDRGQLGAGSAVTLPCATATLPCRASPIDIALPDTISVPRDLALGERHSCVLTSGGELFCWGEGEGGRLGLGALGDTCDGPYGGPPACRATPQRVDGTFVAIASGHAHTCAIREGGEVDCWGTNDRGQLGGAPGDTSDSPRPVIR
jgi:alpha-tubulin suppressor-like RCC1 family protein